MAAHGNSVATVNCFVALPVCAGSARFPENGDERSDVPWRHQRIDGNLGTAGGYQDMSAAVSPASGDANAVHDLHDGIEAVGLAPVRGFGKHQPSICEGGGLGGEGLSGRLIADLPPASAAVGRVDYFTQGWHTANAGDHPILEFNADECPE